MAWPWAGLLRKIAALAQWFHIREDSASSILSRTTGFIAEAGFTHSLTPARNCTFGCTYCYVPTMLLYGGLKKEDWQRWGQFTTLKSNAAELLARAVRGNELIYCSPLVDPYQPAEADDPHMPAILEALTARPPRLFVFQTRGPLILRDLPLIERLATRTDVRVSFSITTNREDVRRLYEPHCAAFAERLDTVRRLRASGIRTFSTLAPLLPCDPEELAAAALDATTENLVGDPFHSRVAKPHGATTRKQAEKISAIHGFGGWHDPEFYNSVIERIRTVARAAGRDFGVGPPGFGWLAA